MERGSGGRVVWRVAVRGRAGQSGVERRHIGRSTEEAGEGVWSQALARAVGSLCRAPATKKERDGEIGQKGPPQE